MAPPRLLRPLAWATLAALLVSAGAALWLGRTRRDGPPLATTTTAKPGWTFSEQLTRVNAAGETVRFGERTEDAEPIVREAAVEIAGRWLVLPDVFEGGGFTEVLTSPDGTRWLAIQQFSTEAAGDVQLLASDDGGRTFVHRATVPWPNYMGTLEPASFDGKNLRLVMSLDQDGQLAEAYWSDWDRLLGLLPGERDRPMIGRGRYALDSHDGGRTFSRLTRLGDVPP